jgi:hypothetical protein
MSVHRIRAAAATRRAAAALAIALLAGTLGIAPASAAELDFGAVNVGGSIVRQRTLPLTYALSQIPGGTVLYAGGNATIDFALASSGLSVPLTAGALYAKVGEVTATYHLILAPQAGTDFMVQNGDCGTTTVSCIATVTFEPAASGLRTDTIGATILDLQVTGGGTFASLIGFLAPFIATSVQGQLAVQVSGVGIAAGEPGTVAATVDVLDAAACLEISTSAIDFGILQLGTVDAPAAPSIGVTNCAQVPGEYFVRGTHANGPGADWSLVETGSCATSSMGLDAFRLRLAGAGTPVELSTVNRPLGTLAAGGASNNTARMDMACAGSAGGGTAMSFQLIFLATTEG